VIFDPPRGFRNVVPCSVPTTVAVNCAPYWIDAAAPLSRHPTVIVPPADTTSRCTANVTWLSTSVPSIPFTVRNESFALPFGPLM